MCFQVCFNTKPSEKKIAENLSEIKGKLKNAAAMKELAKECMQGKESI